MIKVEPYECYKEYLAIKRHFTSPSYDYFKYDSMNIRTSKMTFSKRKDNFLFAKLAKTYNDEEITKFFVANLVDNEFFWMTDTLHVHRIERFVRQPYFKVVIIRSDSASCRF